MGNKRLIENIMFGLGVVVSCVFCVNSLMKLANNVDKAFVVSAEEWSSDVCSVKNITVDNYDIKSMEIESIDSADLEYKEELSEFYQVDTYVDAEESIYMYDEEDKLISYTINCKDVDTVDQITEKIAIEVSEEYLTCLVGDDAGYVLQEVSYDAYLNVYNIVYGHQVCGLQTSDIVYLTINGNKELIGYSIPNAGKFDSVFLDEAQVESVKEQGIALICEQKNNIQSTDLEAAVVLILDNDEIAANVMIEGTICANNEEQTIMDSVIIPLQQ